MSDEKLKEYEFVQELIERDNKCGMPRFWRFCYNDLNDKDILEIRDSNGLFMDLSSVKALIKGLKKYLDILTEEEIKRVNDEIYEQNIEKRSPKTRYSTEDDGGNKNKSGLVYLLKSTEENIYKIGVTTNLDKRLGQISPKLPFEINVEHTIKSERIYELESELHEKFSDKRLNGEWFRLNKNDAKCIKRL